MPSMRALMDPLSVVATGGVGFSAGDGLQAIINKSRRVTYRID